MSQDSIKQTRARSVAYPSVTLEDAFNRAQKLDEALGSAMYSRDDAVRGMGYTSMSGAAARAVAALVQYGLLERHGNAYRLSDLAKRAIRPLPGEEPMIFLRAAALSPKLFKSVAHQFTGQALPALLKNVLSHQGVSPGASVEVAQTLRKTFEYAGILKNGIVNAEHLDGEQQAAERSGSEPSSQGGVVIPKQMADFGQDFTFDFSGITLVIPRSAKTSDAIADGELKEIRRALSEFAAKFVAPNEPD